MALSSLYQDISSDLVPSDDGSMIDAKVALVAALYNRHITGPSSLLDHIKFELSPPSSNRNVQVAFSAFNLSLKRYLQGRGHPDHPNIRTIVHPTNINEDKDSLALRSVLLMQSIYGSYLIPVIRGWRIRVGPFVMSCSAKALQCSTVQCSRITISGSNGTRQFYSLSNLILRSLALIIYSLVYRNQ